MIVLDTNIWYRISENKISREKLNSREICLTALVLLEILTSPRWDSEENEMREAVKTIIELKPLYIPYLHYEYLAKQIFENNYPYYNKLEYNSLEMMLNGSIDVSTKNELIKTRKKLTINFVDDYKNRTNEIKHNQEITSKLNSYDSCKYHIFNDIMSEVEDTTTFKRSQINPSKLQKYLSELELHAHCRFNFYSKTTLHVKNVKRNDLFDLMNLVYVGSNDKYWTGDGEWLKYISKDMINKYVIIYKGQ